MQLGQYEEVADPAELPARLRNVLWLGGGSGAGKSTIARRLLSTLSGFFPHPISARRLKEETEGLQLRTIHVDTTMTEDDLAERVSTTFRL